MPTGANPSLQSYDTLLMDIHDTKATAEAIWLPDTEGLMTGDTVTVAATLEVPA